MTPSTHYLSMFMSLLKTFVLDAGVVETSWGQSRAPLVRGLHKECESLRSDAGSFTVRQSVQVRWTGAR